ncbi:MAG: HD domain-containing protein [Candidatus Bathyarchaeota archaeon]|nr:HD domain-containing protein [Candidatus Bathyarchaeota archaeon]
MDSLLVLRIGSLLHDIGKIRCWSLRDRWTEHVRYTYEMLVDIFSEYIASTAMRHHSSRYYSVEYHPKTDIERIICISDSIASGADRPEEDQAKLPRPPSEIELSHPLTRGKPIRTLKGDYLRRFDEELCKMLREIVDGTKSMDLAYRKFFDKLSEERSPMMQVPAYTNPPINDHSIFDHGKLTAAIATCIYLSGGYKGERLEDYRFSLLSGDVDGIQSFINASRRLPDLVGGSRLINVALENAVRVVEEMLGPECIVYKGGGGFLALTPPSLVDEIGGKARDAFEESGGGLTISYVTVNGSELGFFGDVWRKAIQNMRRAKSERRYRLGASIAPDEHVCDVCGLRRATATPDWDYPTPLEARIQPDYLCDVCFKRRDLGKSSEGISIDEIGGKDPYHLVCILKIDGDKIGRLLDGSRIKEELGKNMSPSRLSAISRLIHETSEYLKEFVEKHGGRCIYAGGDDILAILPGIEGLKAAPEMSRIFEERLAGFSTVSGGAVLIHRKSPLSVALEWVRELLEKAKDAGRNRFCYVLTPRIGVTPSEIAEVERIPIEWGVFREILRIADELVTLNIPPSQLRMMYSLITELRRHPEKRGKAVDEALYIVKRQVSRGVIPFEVGVQLIDSIKNSLFEYIVELFMLSRRGGIQVE